MQRGCAVATKKLSAYQAKRDFTLTREPSGEAAAPPGPRLRFVVQKHDATRLHYDLRLELDGVFKSWAVTKGPSLDPHDKRLAVEVEDHPLEYGDFEGTIPEGQYGGGTVQLWDRGYWAPQGMTAEEGLASGDLKFTLEGEHLHGSWVLVRIKNWSGGKRVNWLLIKHRDDFAQEGDDGALLAADRSVASGRAMAEIASGTGAAPTPFMANPAPRPKRRAAPKQPSGLPDFIEPQLCQSVRPAARRRRVGARDQVRRLPHPGPHPGRRGDAAHAQGAGLDGEVRGGGRGLRDAAGRDPRWGDRGAGRSGGRRISPRCRPPWPRATPPSWCSSCSTPCSPAARICGPWR